MTEPTLAIAPQEQDLDRMAREIGIPPCPAILSRFSTEMQQAEPDTRKLAALIGTDIALSAQARRPLFDLLEDGCQYWRSAIARSARQPCFGYG